MYTLKRTKHKPTDTFSKKKKPLERTPTLFAQKSPQALQSDLGPDGPRRIIGVDFELVPQCVQLLNMQFKEWWLKSSYKPSTEEKT